MKKTLLTIIGLASVLAVAQAAPTTILNYSTGATNVAGSTGYFNSGNGWSAGTNWVGQSGGVPTTPAWTGSGASSNNTVENIAGFSPGVGQNSGTLGAYYTLSSSVNRTFTPMSAGQFTNIAVSFTAEWGLAEFVAPGVLNNDTFAFDLKSGVTSGLKFTIADNGAAPGQYAITDANGNGYTELYSGFVYRLQVDILPNDTWTATLYNVANPSTTRTITVNASGATGALQNPINTDDLNNLSVSYTAGAVNADAFLVVNELTIQSTGDPIPEPGTWAVGALLLSGAAATIYRRRKSRTAQPAA
jgi:hypothetical protein